MKGENDPDQTGGLAAANPLRRIPVLLAGAAMNLLTAVVVYTFFFAQVGLPDSHKVEIGAVSPNSPAQQAGLKAGDIVISANGQTVDSTQKLINIAYAKLGQPVALVVQRNGQTLDLTIQTRANPPSGQGPMGIQIGNPVEPVKSWFQTVPSSFAGRRHGYRPTFVLRPVA